jgi:hypothetical protein
MLWLPLSVLALRFVLTYLILLPVLLIFIWVTYNRSRCNKTFWHFFQDRPLRYCKHFSLVLKLSILKNLVPLAPGMLVANAHFQPSPTFVYKASQPWYNLWCPSLNVGF